MSAPGDPLTSLGPYENRIRWPKARAVSDGIEYAGVAFAAAPWDGRASQWFVVVTVPEGACR